MKKKEKRFAAKRYPLYSIQFSIDRSGMIHMYETSNIKDGTEPLVAQDAMSFYKFGVYLAKSKLLTRGDKLAIARMFDAFNRNI